MGTIMELGTPASHKVALLIAGVFVFSFGCSDADPAEPICVFNDECETGEVCTDGACIIDISQVNIRSFVAETSSVDLGDSVQLSWEIASVSSARISGSDGFEFEIGPGSLGAGTVEVTPLDDTTYTLRATKDENTTQAEVTVSVVRPAGAILDFQISESSIQEGEEVTFSWSTSNAINGEILRDGEPFLAIEVDYIDSGSIRTDSATSGAYTLVINGEDGGIVTSDPIELEVLPISPEVERFVALSEFLLEGQATTLQWEVIHTDEIEIAGPAGVLHTSANSQGAFNVQPAESTTYRLRAKRDQLVVERELDITVYEPIEILSFSGTPPVALGESTDLTWEISGDVEALVLSDGFATYEMATEDFAQGTFSLQPSVTTTYSIIASNEAHAKTAEFEVVVLPAPPTITRFDAAPTLVATGATTTLSWEIEGADSYTLSDGTQSLDTTGVSSTNGLLTTPVSGPTTYTLSASNAGGTTDATVFVDTAGAVSIQSFSVAPNALAPGETATVTWTTANATSIELRDSDGTIIDVTTLDPAGDSLNLIVDTSKTLILTANGLGGPASASAQFVVNEPVEILDFQASAVTVSQGDSLSLSWQTEFALGVEIECTDIDGNPYFVTTAGTNKDSDSVTFSPSVSSTCRLSAFGFRGPDTLDVSFTVLPQAPTVLNFTVSESTILAGQDVVLNWESQGATSFTLTDDLGNNFDLTGLDPALDSITLQPTQSATYTLTVSNAAGSDASTASVDVVDGDALMVNEVFFDPVGADDNLEWVEFINTSDSPIDLASFWVGNGGADYTYSRLQLQGTIAPQGCFVVGGPTSSASNGLPALDQASAFTPALQNGGAEADGIGVFFGEPTAASVPLDVVLYGGANNNNLVGEDGLPKLEVSTRGVSGESLVRVSSSDLFEISAPTPNRCFQVASTDINTASNTAPGTIQVLGWALDSRLFQVEIGSVLLNCTDIQGGLECSWEAHTESGLVDIVVSRVRDFTFDGSNWTITDRAPLDIQSEVLGGGFTWLD
ncbi:lamin tail domain-containing protein [Microvenator marinus]|uniref:Lamin tail domain-containing protein n=1 Tax=Microvenator marinus TaxID=2600177 RepID=A0A5B8XPL5_9DELT|nr:lamin tail domain-containing protein [Microvenator marinus]QED27191.1 lamin tail domain-containing protein [Microvenator marinus]